MVKYTSDVTLYRAGEGKKNQMIKKDNTSKQIRIYCLVVGIISFFIVSVCGQLLNRNTVNEEKMRAAFTAETTVNRIRSQLNRYLDVSEFFQNIIESGHQIDDEVLDFIFRLKTGALIESAMMIGAILAGASKEDVKSMQKVAGKIGMAFQIQDDILDVTSTTEQLGKPVGVNLSF